MHLLGALALLATIAFAASADEWRSRSIYQVLTDRFARSDGSTTATCKTGDRVYCGGTWSGLNNRLDYIQGMGFDAVWISPITAQLEGITPYGEAYHGYWQQSINTLNSHFGSSDDLSALSAALHARGMYLMVDVVVNHVAWNGSSSTVNYGQMDPFSNPDQYHSYCSIDFANTGNMTQMENCWMGDQIVSLPDLRTEDSGIAATWNSWISQTVSTYGIDGLRLDSVMEVNRGFWSGFQSAANVYMIGEVYQGAVDFVCGYQSSLPGVMNYPIYFPLIAAFQNTSGSISSLANAINAVKASCSNTSLLGSFSENHDQPRFASLNGDIAAAQNILAYTILADGIPVVYQGQEQHYNALGGSNEPYNREALWTSGYNTTSPLYTLIGKLNAARKNAIAVDAAHLSYQNWPIWNDGHTLAMRKGNMVVVLTNSGSSATSYSFNLSTTYTSGTSVTELLSCSQSLVQTNGTLSVSMNAGLPKVFYPTAATGVQCGGTTASSKSKKRGASVGIAFKA